jgi:hypothetical protein
MTDLSTRLAEWKANKMRGPIPSGLLARLEASHDAKEARIRESRTLTAEAKRLETTESRRQFRSDWFEMRGQVLEQMDADIETAKRTANPPTDERMLSRMGLLSAVHLPRWQRSPGNLAADVERFAREGDAAGLRLVREHSGLLAPGARGSVLEAVGKAEEPFKTDAQRKAEQDVQSLEGDREQFEMGTGLRENFIRAKTSPILAPPADPVSAAYPRPQR